MRISFGLFVAMLAAVPAGAADLPVDAGALMGGRKVTGYRVRNALSLEQVFSAVKGGEKGLEVDLSGVTRLLDGTEIDPAKIHGTVHYGPYPFSSSESLFHYKLFRRKRRIEGGRARIKAKKFLKKPYNSEGWKDSGTLAVRLELFLASPGKDRALGVYDTRVAFRRTDAGFERLPWIVEGPTVNRIDSRTPGEAVIAYRTDRPVEGRVLLGDGRKFSGPRGLRHEIRLTGLRPGDYGYRVRVGSLTSVERRFRSAPPPDTEVVRFAYAADSREGEGGGMRNYMGVNHAVMQSLSSLAFREGADFMLFGGDLIDGHTTSEGDFVAQIHAWKQAVQGFAGARPVYAGIGNHESLLARFDLGKREPVSIDRWPYASKSAEAVFARELTLPVDSPKPSDPRRPSYRETVYTVQYGPVRVIVLNNSYWLGWEPEKYGGSPEGYFMEDQLRWLETRLVEADTDPSVRHVLVMAHEPPFPSSVHVKDAMWYNGDNATRAHTFREGKLRPAALGILEVRDRLVRAAASSRKVAAVLGSDEHCYHRVLIDGKVPVGDLSRDDKNGDGKIDWNGAEPASPLKELEHPVWYLTSGGAGAPYYTVYPAPWVDHWKSGKDGRDGFRFSPQENILLFEVRGETLSMRALNREGELIDEIRDLTAVKRKGR